MDKLQPREQMLTRGAIATVLALALLTPSLALPKPVTAQQPTTTPIFDAFMCPGKPVTYDPTTGKATCHEKDGIDFTYRPESVDCFVATASGSDIHTKRVWQGIRTDLSVISPLFKNHVSDTYPYWGPDVAAFLRQNPVLIPVVHAALATSAQIYTEGKALKSAAKEWERTSNYRPQKGRGGRIYTGAR